ncbi:hypothetical protein MPY17_39420 (plasmid) [Rhodococcus opacus]|uniref:hypothetical protein n=1 Tax=Rhodococcus opacus TaxID=37919 RepID=UPI001FF24B5E|nr:hypothetical protein [Rhodococcus opacus]UOT08364.1 hypothetical protein MPY17_39420 [Rhodococcus opacus]
MGGALDDLANGVELRAGVSVEFASSLSVGAGVGVSAGFQAGIGASVDVSLGLAAGIRGGAGPGAGLLQGFALSSAGGPTAAAETAKASAATAAADAARASFGITAAEAMPTTAGTVSRRPLATAVSSRTQPATAAPPAPLPPNSDRRSTSYGWGVPLRDQVSVPGSQAASYVVVGSTSPVDVSGLSRRRGRAAPWERLAPTASRDVADREQHRRRPSCGCHRCDPLRGGM